MLANLFALSVQYVIEDMSQSFLSSRILSLDLTDPSTAMSLRRSNLFFRPARRGYKLIGGIALILREMSGEVFSQNSIIVVL